MCNLSSEKVGLLFECGSASNQVRLLYTTLRYTWMVQTPESGIQSKFQKSFSATSTSIEDI